MTKLSIAMRACGGMRAAKSGLSPATLRCVLANLGNRSADCRRAAGWLAATGGVPIDQIHALNAGFCI